MTVSGDEAKNYDAIRLDSFTPVNQGPLLSANEQTGEVQWKDAAGETKIATLGQHAIKIVVCHRLGR